MRIAVIPATYNRPDMLELQLQGYLEQTYRDFEVIVADDGSSEETRALVEKYRKRASFRIDHVWQKNEGYRASTIRNKAIAISTSDYLVLTDQDCVPPPDFLAHHARLAEQGWFVPGNRILVSQSYTTQVLADKTPLHAQGWLDWVSHRMRGDINRIQPLLTLPDGQWRKLHPAKWHGAKTCNLAVWKKDYIQVNGMDESFVGWGMEDSDLVVRLIRSGIRHKSGRFACPVFHLWHPESNRGRLEENQKRLQQVIDSTHVRAPRGIDQYL